MRRILVVAHRTLGGEHLREEVQRRLGEGDVSFHLLVPERHPNDHAWTDGEVRRAAEAVLDEGLQFVPRPRPDRAARRSRARSAT